MRVCVLAHTLYDSDARVKREAECLSKLGHRIDLICLRGKNDTAYERFGRIHVYRIMPACQARSALGILLQLIGFFVCSMFWMTIRSFRHRYDLIHVHTVPDFEVYAAVIPKWLGIPILLDMHEIMPELYMRKFGSADTSASIKAIKLFEKLSVGFADHVILATPFLRDALVERAAPADKCTVVLNVADPKYFGNTTNGRSPEGSDLFQLVYPGTLSELHGVDVVFGALKLLQHEANIPLMFHIYGSGPSYRELLELRRKLGIEHLVTFHDGVPTDQLAAVLRRMDLGVVPKRAGIFADEAISTKLFEFAAVGLPAVVSRTRGDSLFFDDESVCFFEPENERELAQCIRRLHADRDYRNQLSLNAKAVYERNNWNVVKQHFIASVEGLVGSKLLHPDGGE